MRKTIRHVAVLAAAVAMLTTIAVPTQGAMAPPVDSFEVTCGPNHYVTVEAADESRNERERYLTLWLWIASPDPPGWVLIDGDGVRGTGLLELEIAGDVGTSEYTAKVRLITYWETKKPYAEYIDQVTGYC